MAEILPSKIRTIIIVILMCKKVKECVHRIRMPPLSTKVNRGITPEQKKWLKVLVYKFQMIY